jgi:subtilisin family serine protease
MKGIFAAVSSSFAKSLKTLTTIGFLLVGVIGASVLVERGSADSAEPTPQAAANNPEEGPLFEEGIVIVQFAADVVSAARSGLQPGKHLAGRLAELPEVAALNQALHAKSMSPALTTSRRSGAQRTVAPARAWRDRYYVVELGEGQDVLESVRRYERLPGVVSAQPSYILSPDHSACGDPCEINEGNLWYYLQWLQSHKWTDAELGWAIETGDPSTVIAILGKGVDATHEDLAANMWVNVAEIPNNGIDDDGNDFVDDRLGWNFVGDNNDLGPGVIHETAVAGVAAAVGNNGLGVAGVCWACKIMNVKTAYLGEGSSTQKVANGVLYAVDNGARVINMSFGHYFPDDAFLEEAVSDAFYQGVVVVASAGNDTILWERFPAAYDNVIAVAATYKRKWTKTASNFGSWVTVAAPGEEVWTTTPSSYGGVTGTSFAAPYVAGLAGLLLSKDPALSPTSVRRRIEYSVKPANTPLYLGTGLVNVHNAIALDADPDLFAVIKDPMDAGIVSAPVPVFGTALGNDYELEYKPEGGATWTLVSSGPQIIDGELGILDLTGVANGFYDLRLTAKRGSDTHVDQVTVMGTDEIAAGWPQEVDGPIRSDHIYFDLSQDGTMELLVSTDFISKYTGGWVSVWRHDGTLVWDRVLGLDPFSVIAGPSVGDLDGNGITDVIQIDSNGRFRCWEQDGSSFCDVVVGGLANGGLALANLDSGSQLEILVATRNEPVVETLKAFQADGSQLPGWAHVETEEQVMTTPAVGDLDGDRDPDIVVRGDRNVFAFHHDGTVVNGWPVRTSMLATASAVLADLDGDGSDEVIITEWGGGREHPFGGLLERKRNAIGGGSAYGGFL